jgi:subtilase family serine protease
MQRMILMLTHSDAQEVSLNTLLAQQQDKSSPNFHQWLTPVEFGAQFGASDADIKTITDWLSSQGFSVSKVGNGKNYIEFNGTAAQVSAAFQTTIHKYSLNGNTYQANTSDPTIPTALTSVVKGVLSLHNFPRQSHHQSAGTFQRDNKTGKVTRTSTPSKLIMTPEQAKSSASGKAVSPDFTFNPAGSNIYAVSPYDFATIYNVLPLWNAGIDGTGQTIAVLEETDIHLDDVRAFRSLFSLPAKDRSSFSMEPTQASPTSMKRAKPFSIPNGQAPLPRELRSMSSLLSRLQPLRVSISPRSTTSTTTLRPS